jgi:TolB-like protein/Tfp pilus assembly protein PilF
MNVPRPSFFAELQRRNVYKIGAMYGVAGWLLVQVATQVFPFFDIPNWVVRVVVIAIVAGFPLTLALSWIYELTPQGIVKTDEVAPDASITRQTGQRLNHAIIATLSLAVLVLLGKILWPHAVGGTAAPAAAAAGDKSIAVLPFANLSSDPDNAFFADGMQDEILTKLAKIGALRVVSRTSTQRYASAPPNVAEIAKQLGVSNILEGSVQKAGNAVHINVQLIRADGDQHLWAESYNRKLDDMFGVEGEVAQAVAEALNTKLSGIEQEAVAAKPTSNPEAYEAYLRGRAILGADYSDGANQRALTYFGEAARLDPKFVLAWAQVALARTVLYFDGWDRVSSTAAAIREAAETALKLQPDSGEALLAHGYYLYRVEHDYPGAQRDFHQVLAKLPNDRDALEGLFLVERRMGQWDQAIADSEEAIRRNPKDVSLLSPMGCEGVNYLRRFDQARGYLNHALEVTPDAANTLGCLALVEQAAGRLDAADAALARVPLDMHDLSGYQGTLQALYRRDFAGAARLVEAALPQDDAQLTGSDVQNLLLLGYARKWNGDARGAQAAFEREVRVLTSAPDAMEHVEMVGHHTLALAYAGLGRGQDAIEAARAAVELNANDAIKLPLALAAQAQVYAAFGQADAAIALLPRLLQMPAGLTPPLLARDPMWDPIRNDPRFQKLATATSL